MKAMFWSIWILRQNNKIEDWIDIFYMIDSVLSVTEKLERHRIIRCQAEYFDLKLDWPFNWHTRIKLFCSSFMIVSFPYHNSLNSSIKSASRRVCWGFSLLANTPSSPKRFTPCFKDSKFYLRLQKNKKIKLVFSQGKTAAQFHRILKKQVS